GGEEGRRCLGRSHLRLAGRELHREPAPRRRQARGGGAEVRGEPEDAGPFQGVGGDEGGGAAEPHLRHGADARPEWRPITPATNVTGGVEAKKVRVEVRQSHELAGLVAVHAKEWDTALAELGKAGTQNPRVTYLTGLAWQGKGDQAKAAEAFKSVADYNQLNG